MAEEETQAKSDNDLKDNNNRGISYADKRRQEKAKALREFLEGQKYIEAIERDLNRDIQSDELQQVKFKTETRLKLLSKVLPDLKAIEHSGDADSPLGFTLIERVIVDPYKP